MNYTKKVFFLATVFLLFQISKRRIRLDLILYSYSKTCNTTQTSENFKKTNQVLAATKLSSEKRGFAKAILNFDEERKNMNKKLWKKIPRGKIYKLRCWWKTFHKIFFHSRAIALLQVVSDLYKKNMKNIALVIKLKYNCEKMYKYERNERGKVFEL